MYIIQLHCIQKVILCMQFFQVREEISLNDFSNFLKEKNENKRFITFPSDIYLDLLLSYEQPQWSIDFSSSPIVLAVESGNTYNRKIKEKKVRRGDSQLFKNKPFLFRIFFFFPGIISLSCWTGIKPMT